MYLRLYFGTTVISWKLFDLDRAAFLMKIWYRLRMLYSEDELSSLLPFNTKFFQSLLYSCFTLSKLTLFLQFAHYFLLSNRFIFAPIPNSTYLQRKTMEKHINNISTISNLVSQIKILTNA